MIDFLNGLGTAFAVWLAATAYLRAEKAYRLAQRTTIRSGQGWPPLPRPLPPPPDGPRRAASVLFLLLLSPALASAQGAIGVASGDQAIGRSNVRGMGGIGVGVRTAVQPSRSADFEDLLAQHLSVADNPTLSVSDEDFGFALWINADDFDVVNAGPFGKWSASNTNQSYALVRLGGNLAWVVDGASFSQTNHVVAPLASFSAGTWYLVYVFHDADDNVLGSSVDGGTISTSPHSTGAYDDSNAFLVGNYLGNSTGRWDGNVAVLAFWKGSRPSEAQINSLYNGGVAVTCASVQSLVGIAPAMCCDLDEVSGDRTCAIGALTLTDINSVGSEEGLVGK